MALPPVMRKGRLIKEIFPITATSPRTAVSRPLAGAGKNQCSSVGLAAAVPTSPSPPRVAPTGRQAPPAGFVLAPLLPARTPARTNARANAADSLDGSTPGLRVSAGEFASSSAEQIFVWEFMKCAQYFGRRSTTADMKCLRYLHLIAYFPHGTEACVGGTAAATQWRARPAYIYDNKRPMGVRAGVTRKAVAQ